MKRVITFAIAAFILAINAFAQEYDKSVIFSNEDGTILGMDVYLPQNLSCRHKCIVYAYGGGFMENNQRAKSTKELCRRFADDGYVVCAIDYRLGLKDFKAKGGPLTMIKPVDNSVRIAAEDMFKAVKCIIDNASALHVYADSVILCGSSAGAVTSLQADYELCNRTPMTAQMPEDFRFAGVISFAGAIFSHEGKCDYRIHAPAPTFFLHGTNDKLVNYRKIQLFKLGFFGSSELVKRFDKFGYPYKIMRFEGEGHSVAMRMMDNYDDVIWFIDNMVCARRNMVIDESVQDRDRELTKWDKMNSKGLYMKK